MNILVIIAHPDDPEFFAGGTIARWCAEGHDVRYVIVTGGDKGSLLEPPAYQKLEGPWVNGKDPSGA